MEAAQAHLGHTHSPSPGGPKTPAEALEALEAPVEVEEADIATGGLARRFAPAAVEAGPVVSRFTEMQAACTCASGCPMCITITVGSFALPFIFRGRKGETEPEQ